MRVSNKDFWGTHLIGPEANEDKEGKLFSFNVVDLQRFTSHYLQIHTTS